MGKLIGGLLGKPKKPKGPSEAEKQLQADRAEQANRDNAEEDKKAALISRASSLRKSLSYQGGGADTIGG